MGGVINIITESPKDAPNISTSYRASSFGGTPKQISNDPINSIIKSSLTIPLNNFNFTTDITYQHFLKGQQFEYISADQIDKINFNNELSWHHKRHNLKPFTANITKLMKAPQRHLVEQYYLLMKQI